MQDMPRGGARAGSQGILKVRALLDKVGIRMCLLLMGYGRHCSGVRSACAR